MPPVDVTVGIDIGSSGAKLVAADRDGRILFETSHELTVDYPAPGLAEHDAEDAWWGTSVQLLRRTCEQPDLKIVGISVSGLGPCVVPLDAAGHALRPAILYGIDSRATAQIAELNSQLGEDTILGRCAHPLTAESVGPKIRWLQQNEPEVWAATRALATAHSYVVLRLTGQLMLDHSSASWWDPLYDPWDLEWASDMAVELGLPPGFLPRLGWPAEIAGHVTAAASAQTGIARGTPVTVGVIDFVADLIGAGVEDFGQTCITYGSTLAIDTVTDRVIPGHAVSTTVGPRPGQHLLGGVSSTSGALTTWIRSIAGNPSFESLIAAAENSPPGSNGLVILPYFAGERAPIFDADAKGVIAGLTLSHNIGDLYRASLEATGHAAQHILTEMRAANAAPQSVVATGGGTRSRLWVQILSDCIGLDQRISTVSMTAPYGGALMAARAIGAVNETHSWATTRQLVTVQEHAAAVYHDGFELYRRLDSATRPITRRLGNITRQN